MQRIPCYLSRIPGSPLECIPSAPQPLTVISSPNTRPGHRLKHSPSGSSKQLPTIFQQTLDNHSSPGYNSRHNYTTRKDMNGVLDQRQDQDVSLKPTVRSSRCTYSEQCLRNPSEPDSGLNPKDISNRGREGPETRTSSGTLTMVTAQPGVNSRTRSPVPA